MSSKEQDETELAIAGAEINEDGQQEQQPPQDEFEGSTEGGASNSNENKWNKNGFGQGEATMTMRTGKYTQEETETIIRAVKEYCNLKQISVTRLCSECDHKADLKGSWMEIAKCLPNRPVQSVYRHGLRQLHPFKRGAWTDAEVETLIGLVSQVGKKWAHIQAKLNRSADSCRDKFREVDDTFVRGRWKENETEQLKRLVREYLRVDPAADMKEIGKMVYQEDIKIPWSVISKRMGKRSRLSCFKKWQKLTGLYSPCDMHRNGASPSTGSRLPTPQQQLPTSSKEDVATEKDATAAAGNTEESGDPDVYLLSELVSLEVAKAAEVQWEDMRIENAEERWFELLEEWQSTIMDDSLLALPIAEIAQRILDRKTSAQRAAETVEAVDLPNPLWNND